MGNRFDVNASQMKVGPGWIKAVKKPIPIMVKKMTADFFVQTLEGKMIGRKGDYLAIGTHGERYIIRENIFQDSYEIIER